MWTGIADGTLDVAMGSYTAAQSVLQSNNGVVFAVHSKKVAAIPEIKTLPELGATSKFFTVSGFSGWAVPKATPQPIVDRLSELCVAANSDPKVKEILATFVLEPAIGFKESNALYQQRIAGVDRGRASAGVTAGVSGGPRDLAISLVRGRIGRKQRDGGDSSSNGAVPEVRALSPHRSGVRYDQRASRHRRPARDVEATTPDARR